MNDMRSTIERTGRLLDVFYHNKYLFVPEYNDCAGGRLIGIEKTYRG